MDTAVIERFTRPIIDRDVDAYRALFHEDAVQYEPLFPEPARGREAIVAGESALFDAFNDIEIDVRHAVVQDRLVILEVVLAATNHGPLDVGAEEPLPPTHARVRLPMVWVLELDEDGLIIEERDYFDTAEFQRQLGLEPVS